MKKFLVGLAIFVGVCLIGLAIKLVTVEKEKIAHQKEMEEFAHQKQMEAVWARKDAFYARFPPKDTIEGQIALFKYFDEHYPSIAEMEASLKEIKPLVRHLYTIDLTEKERVSALKKLFREKVLFDVYDPDVEMETGEIFLLFMPTKLVSINQKPDSEPIELISDEKWRDHRDKIYYLKYTYVSTVISYFSDLDF